MIVEIEIGTPVTVNTTVHPPLVLVVHLKVGLMDSIKHTPVQTLVEFQTPVLATVHPHAL
jgi:hypothetical protein